MLSISEVIVEFPTLPIKLTGDFDEQDSGNTVGGFSVSIANDGNSFSKNESIFIVYDGRCMQCDTVTCKQKVGKTMDL